jgi:hypothetical protein
MANEAIAAADAAGSPGVASELRLKAVGEIPRFPSLQPLHAELLRQPLDIEDGEARLTAEALRQALHVAQTMRIDAFIPGIAERARAAEARSDDAFVQWFAALATAAEAARSKGYASAMDAYRRAQSKTEALGREALSLDLDLVRLDLELRHGQHNGVLNATAAILDDLEGRDSTWDGERFHVQTALGLIHIHRDESQEAEVAMTTARDLAAAHGLVIDEAQILVGLVPLWLHTQQATQAVSAMRALLPRLTEVEESATMEMALRSLLLRALREMGAVGEAIGAGFEAVKRAGAVGNVTHFTSFMLTTATLYYEVGRHGDCYNCLKMAEEGLATRDDASEMLEQVQAAKRGLEADVGEARYAALVAQYAADEH